MCTNCGDFTTLSAHQASALRAWFYGHTYNSENLAEAFTRLGIRVGQRSVNDRPGKMLCDKTGAVLL